MNFQVGKEVVWHDGNGNEIAHGKIIGVKYTSNLGNIYKVSIYSNKKGLASYETKNIHQNCLKLK